jgi:hypothetical protein
VVTERDQAAIGLLGDDARGLFERWYPIAPGTRVFCCQANGTGLMCTRVIGHDGPHVAHGERYRGSDVHKVEGIW